MYFLLQNGPVRTGTSATTQEKPYVVQ